MITTTRTPLLPDSKAICSRTMRQPLTWICFNRTCGTSSKPFVFTSEYAECPKCTSTGWPTIKLRTLIHLLVPDKRGPIPGRKGRFRIACEPKRQYTTRGLEKEGATNHTHKVNCSGCNQWLEAQGIKTPTILTHGG